LSLGSISNAPATSPVGGNNPVPVQSGWFTILPTTTPVTGETPVFGGPCLKWDRQAPLNRVNDG